MGKAYAWHQALEAVAERYRPRRSPSRWRCPAPRTRVSISATRAPAATQTEDLAEQRIAACTAMIDSGRLKRQTGRRRLCAARPRLSRSRRHRARHRRSQPGDHARARFRARLSEPRQCLVRARQLRPGDRRLRRDHQARSQLALALRQPRHGAARPRLHRRRAGGLSKGDRASAATATRPISGRGQIYLRQKDYARAIADFDRAVHLSPSADNLHAAGAGARRRRRSRPRAERLPGSRQARSEKRRRPHRARRHLAQEGRFRQSAGGL